MTDYYRVNIFSGSIAILNRLAFEGATKRNKPELKVGDVIYCRVSLAHRDLDTELTCISSTSNKKSWSSGESVRICPIFFFFFLSSHL
jgi:exosome complex component RRP40